MFTGINLCTGRGESSDVTSEKEKTIQEAGEGVDGGGVGWGVGGREG